MKMNVMNNMHARMQFAQYLLNSIRVYMEISVFLKLQYYIAQCGPEISGLGAVRAGEQSGIFGSALVPIKFSVDDVFILEQSVTSATTDLTESISLLVSELAEAGKDNYIESLKFWWHSHGDSDVGFTEKIDVPTINRWGNTGRVDYLISYVGNRRGQYLARLDLFKPFHLALLGIPILVELPKDKMLIEQCAADIMEKVKVVPKESDEDYEIAVDAGMIGAPDLPIVVQVEGQEGGDA